MYRPSLTSIISVVFLAYVCHSIWSIAQLFIPPDCEDVSNCLQSHVQANPSSQFILFSSTKSHISSESDLTLLSRINIENLFVENIQKVSMKVPLSVKNNGSSFLHLFVVPIPTKKMDWRRSIKSPYAVYAPIQLTKHQTPEVETFSLLGEQKSEGNMVKRKRDVPTTHIFSKIFVNILTDDILLPKKEVPAEFSHMISISPDSKPTYLPILFVNDLDMRLRDLIIVNTTDSEFDFEFIYKPISFGKLRLFLQFSSSLKSITKLGFTEKDTDEVKGIFSDTNMILLLVTFFVSSVHLLFDFLAFKNDIKFWSGDKSMVGLSTSTVAWRAFSQAIIFLYLLDEDTSLLVLIPAGIGVLIEFWKVTKAFKIKVGFRGVVPRISLGASTKGEISTAKLDSESMKYLSYLLYPLCIGGAIYSLMYMPHKSWYSWTIQSAVNGVYAFGFLFMLPQLFLNYKLKSVAHLPWRSFMYKAFNTFIDDLFAFIITMPTAHRIACFRDDVVFLIYLYQRYLYPVDKTRLDTSGGMMDDDGWQPDAMKKRGKESKKKK